MPYPYSNFVVLSVPNYKLPILRIYDEVHIYLRTTQQGRRITWMKGYPVNSSLLFGKCRLKVSGRRQIPDKYFARNCSGGQNIFVKTPRHIAARPLPVVAFIDYNRKFSFSTKRSSSMFKIRSTTVSVP